MHQPPSIDAQRPYSADAIHLVRTVEQINVQLSQMADQKASILMGATFVVFTISIGQARTGEVSVALLLLAISSFISALLAVMAVLPSVRPSGRAEANLLFFGSFTQLSEEEFTDQVLGLLHDQKAIFRAMLRDVYQNGQVLQHKKYRYLALAYRVFLTGLVLTFISFVAEFLI